ncbi:MAG TPA: class I SAM-dependent methyltransferase [Polyangiaceae bacterium]
MKAKRKSKQKRRTSAPQQAGRPSSDLIDSLALLERRRAPYRPALVDLAAELWRRFPCTAAGPIAEIGSGTGELRGWLPEAWRDRAVHTDPSRAALDVLARRFPNASTERAEAESLPFADGACAAVLGLCAFDALRDQPGAAREAARVLAPGGSFVHLLDMATLLERPFVELHRTGLVPIPNLFGDPSDHAWPLDVVLVEHRWLEGLLVHSAQSGHPLLGRVIPYFGLFLGTRFSAVAASKAFKSVASAPMRRKTLAPFLSSASKRATERGYPPFRPLPFHSARYLKSVLEECFGAAKLFSIELSEVLTARSWQLRADGAPRYRSLCLGHERLSESLPARLLGGAEINASDERTLIEVGVFAFVARRRT